MSASPRAAETCAPADHMRRTGEHMNRSQMPAEISVPRVPARDLTDPIPITSK
jgi:hypothetical protein